MTKKHDKDKKAAAETPPAENAPLAGTEAEPAAPAAEPPRDDQLLRLQADFDNFRKRSRREMAEVTVRVTEAFFADLMPVLDHFEIGLRTAAEHQADAAVQDGFRLVNEELLRVGRKYGLEPVDVAPGAPFDPQLHEAVTHTPSAEHPADTVACAVRRGYRLGDKLLRPAQVVVSSGSPAEASAPETKEPTAEASD